MTELAAPGHATSPAIGIVRRLAVVLPFGLVLLAMLAALFLVWGVEGQLADASQAQQVRQHARDLLQGLVDAESGQRGYLLTDDPAYLAPYKGAGEAIESSYNALLALVRNDHDARSMLTALSVDIAEKRREMASTISLTDAGERDLAIEVVNSDAGRALMDRIRNSIGAFVAQQDGWLASRNAEVAGYRQALVAAIGIALVGASALGLVLFSRGQRRVRDLSVRQTALIEETHRLEAMVQARTADLDEARQHAERERARVETLLQDTSHRIGNSLATVSSLLGLQVTRTGSDAVRAELEAAQSRVHAIASGYRRLRLGADLETVNAGEFLDSVIDDLAVTAPPGPGVQLVKDLDPLVIPARDATTIGIIVNELVTNALKHAFPTGAGGEVRVGLHGDADGVVVLSVSDTGAGMTEGRPASGLGSLIIQQLARQFGGEPQYQGSPGEGTQVIVRLPELKPLPAV